MKEQKDKMLFVSMLVLLVLYFVGIIGIRSPYFHELMLQLSPINLLVSALLLFLNHKQLNKSFFVFCFAAFSAGFFIEILGVKTGLIFGHYNYGSTLGYKLSGVPLIIGLNWLVLIYMAGIICNPLKTSVFVKSILGALLLIVLDLFMEPVAMAYDFWSWHTLTIPIQNYIAWFITGFLILLLFYRSNFEKTNKLALPLYLIQLFFFISLSIFLNLHSLYLVLLIFSFAYPLFKSFENKIQFYQQWKFLFPAIIISAIVFIAWDIWFTHIGIWSFNSDYVLGFYIFNLPIEEWLFFIIVPYSCMFIYEVMNYFVKKDVLASYSKLITNLLAFALLVTAVIYNQQLHTFVTCLSLSIFLFIHQYFLKSIYLGRYYIAWVVCFLPFLIVNGVLTAMPVLIYNEAEIIGLRIFTIPLDDVMYGMLLFLLVITIYEELKQRRANTN